MMRQQKITLVAQGCLGAPRPWDGA